MNEKRKVLVVDDSRMMRVSMRKYLQSEFAIEEAENGMAACTILSSDPAITVVITDANMPEMDGYQLIRFIREHQNEALRSIPIIMITGADEDQVREKALAAGATDFIVKPPDRTQLLARVRAHVKATTENRNLQAQSVELAAAATFDPATQLSGKKYLEVHAAQEFAFAQRHEKDLSIVVLYLDQKAALQQQHGPEVLAQVHRHIAGVLRQITRTEDTVASWSSGHYVILTPASNQSEATILCDRVRKQLLDSVFRYDNIVIPVTLSQGVASLRNDACNTQTALFETADKRAHSAANSGGNRIVVADVSPVIKVKPVTDIQEALALLQRGESERVRASLPILLYKILPLLEVAATQYKWKIQSLFDFIKTRYRQLVQKNTNATPGQSQSSK